MSVKASNFIPECDRDMVDNFAKDTGDYQGLSAVDRMVISLGVSLSKEKNEFNKVNKEPKALDEFRPKSFSKYYETDKNEKYDSSSDDEPV